MNVSELKRENKMLKRLIKDLMFWIDEDGLPELYQRMERAIERKKS